MRNRYRIIVCDLENQAADYQDKDKRNVWRAYK